MAAPLLRLNCCSVSSTRPRGRTWTSPAPPWARRKPRSTGAGAQASACGCWTGWLPNTTSDAKSRAGSPDAGTTDGAIAMTEIVFYQLQRQPLERVLPTLIEKSLERGWRVIVQAASEERVEA